MKLAELGVIYLLVGVGAGAALVRRDGRGAKPLDVLLLVALWPLFGPFLVMRDDKPAPKGSGADGATGETPPEYALLEALLTAGSSPLAEVLPDEATRRLLLHRLRTARERLAEIERLLATRPFSEVEIRARLEALTAQGETRAAALAQKRLLMLERMQAMRRSYQRQLEEVRELLAQLHVQAEVVRFAGMADDSRALVNELVARVRSLDAVLEVEAIVEPG